MWDDKIKKVMELREIHQEGGGPDRIRKQHESGKLTASERIALLLDEGSFVETLSCMATDTSASAVGSKRSYPGDGVITGWGLIDGRKVCVAAEDFTIVGGTLGKAHAEKIYRLQDLAYQMKVPVIFLNDSGGARIEEGINALNGYGEIFQRHVKASGVIPQICAILGPCSGGACYSPALCDFIFVVKDVSKMFITGPAVVESVLGKRPTMEELGGAVMHSEKSGCIHALYNDEASCLEGIRKLLSYLPSNCMQSRVLSGSSIPGSSVSGSPAPGSSKSGQFQSGAAADSKAQTSAAETSSIDWQSIVPDNDRRAYDMHKVISGLMDPGEGFFEIQKHFAPNAIVGFSHLGGKVTGVIANQPQWLGGSLDCDASDKIARFIRFCDCFGIPLLTLVDVPAFLPGTDQEQRGIIRHGAKILYAYSEATVPKITVIVRKAFGGAYIAMNSRSLGADQVYSWPIAQIAVMGAEGAVNILHRREISAAEDPAALVKELKEDYEDRFLNPDIARDRGYIDEVILPEETRERLIRSFDFLSDKQPLSDHSDSWRRHGNIPL